jgi:hypothetical protein
MKTLLSRKFILSQDFNPLAWAPNIPDFSMASGGPHVKAKICLAKSPRVCVRI